MGLEAKKREVTQLLREYRAFHTPFGGAMPTDESHLRSADYHSAGYVEVGAYYDPSDRRMLAESYEYLEAALTLLRREDFEARMSLSSPYLGSEADPSVVEQWRKTSGLVSSKMLVERHDRAIGLLAEYLAEVDLYVVWGKRRSAPGFPDLVMVRPGKRIDRFEGRLIFAELKTDKGKVSAAQWTWLHALASVRCIEVHVFRPRFWKRIEEVLL